MLGGRFDGGGGGGHCVENERLKTRTYGGN